MTVIKRSTSATLHACAQHPRGVYGGSASKISLMLPMQALARCCPRLTAMGRNSSTPIGIDAAPRVDEWSDQPRPDRPLVIREISRTQIAEILWLIVRVTRRERTQAVWREQLIVRHVDDGLPTLLIENGMRQRDREQLIRPNRVVVTVLAVHDVEQSAASLVPETRVERFANAVGASTVAFRSFLIADARCSSTPPSGAARCTRGR